MCLKRWWNVSATKELLMPSRCLLFTEGKSVPTITAVINMPVSEAVVAVYRQNNTRHSTDEWNWSKILLYKMYI